MVMSSINRLLKDKRGNFATMAIFGFPVMFASVALSLDVMNALRLKTELQNANDTAVLFATRSYQETEVLPTNEEIKSYLQANLRPGTTLTVVSAFDPVTKIMTVNSELSSKPILMNYFSEGLTKVYVVSKAKMAVAGMLEFSLALDTTGSMGSDGRMPALKSAANDFINMLFAKKDAGASIRGAIVPFAEYVNVGLSNRTEPWLEGTADLDTRTYGWTNCNKKGKNCTWTQTGGRVYQWDGCVSSRAYPYNIEDAYNSRKFPAMLGKSCTTALLPLTDSRTALVNKINSLTTGGNTYIPDGVMWGTRTLTAALPFAETNTAKLALRRALVIMTDGENTISPRIDNTSNSERSINQIVHTSGNVSRANQYTLEACNAAKQAGLEVYTISFGTGIVVGSTVSNMLRDCATKPSFYNHASNGAALDEAFKEIGAELLTIQLTQ